MMSCRTHGEISAHLSVHPSIPLSPASLWPPASSLWPLASNLRPPTGLKLPICILQDIVLLLSLSVSLSLCILILDISRTSLYKRLCPPVSKCAMNLQWKSKKIKEDQWKSKVSNHEGAWFISKNSYRLLIGYFKTFLSSPRWID